jgi:exosortase/archaeosortase
MEANGHQRDSVGQHFSELRFLLEVAGTVTNSQTFFLFFVSFLWLFYIKFGSFLYNVKSSMICHAMKILLFKVAALISVLYVCFNNLSTQNFEIIDAFMHFV